MNIQKNAMAVLASALLVTLSSCSWFKSNEKTESTVSVPFVVVNVLDKKYYDDCHIVSPSIASINVPMEQLQEYALDVTHGWNKDTTTIIVYCGNYKCLASGESAKMLKELGFKNVWAYEGGIAEWKYLGYPVEGTCGTDVSGFLSDYQKPEGYSPDEQIAITVEQLQEKIKAFSPQ